MQTVDDAFAKLSRSDLDLPEDLAAQLSERSGTYHITPSQLAATIISDWLATH